MQIGQVNNNKLNSTPSFEAITVNAARMPKEEFMVLDKFLSQNSGTSINLSIGHDGRNYVLNNSPTKRFPTVEGLIKAVSKRIAKKSQKTHIKAESELHRAKQSWSKQQDEKVGYLTN